MPELQTIIDKMYENMTPHLKEKEKDACLPPVALIFQGEKMGVIPTPALAVAGPLWREALCQIIKAIHSEVGITAYAVCMESYALMEPTVEAVKMVASGKRVSEIPGHEEVLICTAGNHFQTINKIWLMHRDPETGKICSFTERPIPGDIDIVGAFTDLLVEPRPERLN